ncbi:hypothetical protein HK414_07715 [Ramlibacter terrae]|uniref:Tetratricopeptide repeat protein n=1 Tax=Ramlibacter terrae TaxID=2732511 RepID=A0ABX6P1F6_9BURK|nr:hypothetical protein HK414_07715 [Ramlibacter terrae]
MSASQAAAQVPALGPYAAPRPQGTADASARGAARPRSAVARWKRQLSGFAAAVTTLLVLVALGSATAMWHVIGEVARAEALDEPRSRAAAEARIAVVEVERLLAETIAEEEPGRVRAAAVASIAAASRLEDAVTALRTAMPGDANAAEKWGGWWTRSRRPACR